MYLVLGYDIVSIFFREEHIEYIHHFIENHNGKESYLFWNLAILKEFFIRCHV